MGRYPWPLSDAADEDIAQRAVEASYDTTGAATAFDPTTSTDNLVRALKEDAAKAAAVGLAVTISIGMIPVVGTAIAAIISVIQVASGPYNKRQIKDIVATGTQELLRKVAVTQDTINNAAMQIANAMYPGAQQLAASQISLDGLGDFRQILRNTGGAITDALRTVAKPVAKPFGRLHTMPIRYIGFGILRVAEVYGKLTGDKQFTDKVKAKYRNWDEHSRHFDEVTTRLASDPVELGRRTSGDPAKMVLGKSTVDIARKRVRELVADASAKLTQYQAQALATFATDEYKAAVMLNEAKLIRQDPVMLARADDIHRWEAQANDTLDRALVAAYAGQPTI